MMFFLTTDFSDCLYRLSVKSEKSVVENNG